MASILFLYIYNKEETSRGILRGAGHFYKTLADLGLTLKRVLRIATLPALVRGKPRHQPAALTARTNAVRTIAGV